MAAERWPAVLHEGEASRQIEVSADALALVLHVEGKKQKWPFAEVRYRSGGVPRFERGTAILIVADHKIVPALEILNPQAVSGMEKAAGGIFSAGDFVSGLIAVLIVMAGAAVLAGVIWFLRR